MKTTSIHFSDHLLAADASASHQLMGAGKFRGILLETSITMEPGSWSEIHRETPSTSLWFHTHPDTGATGPKRFYRASLTPR